MIVAVQSQEVVVVATEQQAEFIAVQDLDLMYVGGGTSTGMLF